MIDFYSQDVYESKSSECHSGIFEQFLVEAFKCSLQLQKRKNSENQTFLLCSLIRPDIITKLSTPFTITLKMNVYKF